MLLHVYLDYKSMVAHDFIVKNREGELKYQLFFNRHHPDVALLSFPQKGLNKSDINHKVTSPYAHHINKIPAKVVIS